LADFFYEWRRAKADRPVEPPAERYHLAIQEAFYWGERFENGSTFKDFGVIPSPGTDAALSGFWRGKNRADNEQSKHASGKADDREQKEKYLQRYAGRE